MYIFQVYWRVVKLLAHQFMVLIDLEQTHF